MSIEADIEFQDTAFNADVEFHDTTFSADVEFFNGPQGKDGKSGIISDLVFGVAPLEAPNGVRTTFSVAPYAPNTLRPVVCGSELSRPHANFIETNPSSGLFTLSWAPSADESITVSYAKAE